MRFYFAARVENVQLILSVTDCIIADKVRTSSGAPEEWKAPGQGCFFHAIDPLLQALRQSEIGKIVTT